MPHTSSILRREMCRPMALVATSLAVLSLLGLWATARAATTEKASLLPPPATRPVDFQKDVRQILAGSGYECHGERKQKGAAIVTLLPAVDEDDPSWLLSVEEERPDDEEDKAP